ncbi:MAG TPA: 16S rRNA (guanine(527)-N(7))-methyltransferase RsmG [Planctomycetota bacterium]|jgi:16S rRNA (guanine527-N7)-methyltransferase|nr:16S rRNA (guanine(527)-N(7))-methyltransferase RsmG [Planctomycetota bacterium]
MPLPDHLEDPEEELGGDAPGLPADGHLPDPRGPRPLPAPGEELEAPEEEEEEDEEGPETPVPELSVLEDAMAWAFEGETVEDGVLDIFARHALMVLERNRELNLTAIVDPREVAAKHYLDSWRTCRLIPLFGRRVLDLGSGAGFPGLPMAVGEDDTRVILCESRKKKAAFLQEAVDELGITNASVAAERAEEHLGSIEVDIVVARAISSVRENVRTLRKVKHRLKDFVMLKGANWSREVRSGEREAERLGFHLSTVLEHELPGELGKRAVLVYRAPGGAGL